MKKRTILLLTALLTMLQTGKAEPQGYWISNSIYTWYNADKTSFTIRDAEELAGMAELMRIGTTDFAGKTITLGKDIDLSAHYWRPIGCYTADGTTKVRSFKGTFDAAGHTISGIQLDPSYSRGGLFAELQGGTIKNLKVSNSSSKGSTCGGIVAVNNAGTITNCVVDATVTIQNDINSVSFGGIAGESSGTISGCVSAAQFTPASTIAFGAIGGIVGEATAGSVIDCLYLGTSLPEVTNQAQEGPIIGAGEATFANNFYTTSALPNASGIGSLAHTVSIQQDITLAFLGQTHYSNIANYGVTRFDNGLRYNGVCYASGAVRFKVTATSPYQAFTQVFANGVLLSPVDDLYYALTVGADVQISATLPDILPLADASDNRLLLKANEGKTVYVQLMGRHFIRDGKWNTLCLPFNVTDRDIEEDKPLASGGYDGKTFTGSPLEGATVMELDFETPHNGHVTCFDEDEGILYLNFKEARQIVAGKPYIVKWPVAPDPIVSPTFAGVTIAQHMAGTDNPGVGVSFVGTFGPEPLGGDDDDALCLYLGDNNQLYYPTASNFRVNAFRAYFRVDPDDTGASGDVQVRSFVLHFFDEQSGEAERGDDDEASAIRDAQCPSATAARRAGWYTTDGRRLSGKPSRAGAYIYNGTIVVIQ